MNDSSIAYSRGVVANDAQTSELKVHWYAAYTCAQHEKSVARQLELRSIEAFLPLYEKISRWKDRRVKLQVPLFSGYVFVRMALEDKLRVLQIPSIVRLVGFSGHPMPLDDAEIEALRTGLNNKVRMEPHPFLTTGRRARINGGPLAGSQGTVLRRKGYCRFVISLELIQRSVAVEVDEADLEPMM